MSEGERKAGFPAKLEGAFAVQPDAIFALTVLLDSVPHYDAETLSEFFSRGATIGDLQVSLLGLKTDPERFLFEVARSDERVYAIVRKEPYPLIGEGEPTHIAHAGIWPGSTMSPRLLAELRGERSPAIDKEIALMSQLARRLLDAHGTALVLNRAGSKLELRPEALDALGPSESDQHLPFSAWLNVEVEDSEGRTWISARGYEPFGLPDVSVLLPDPSLEIPTRAGLLYACHFLIGHPEEVPTHLPDRFEVTTGGAIRLGDSCSFAPVRRFEGSDRWHLRLVPAHYAG